KRQLLHRARAVLSPQLPTELDALLCSVEARLVRTEGNLVKCESILRTALDGLSPESPRRWNLLFELALLLAELGRLGEIEKELAKFEQRGPVPLQKARLEAVRFVNAVETGRLAEAKKFLAELRMIDDTYIKPTLRKYERIFNLLEGLLDAQQVKLPEAEDDSDLPDWVLVWHCLLTGNTHQALRWARLCEKTIPEAVGGIGLPALNLIRAELAEGNTDAARRLLELRQEHGNRHYLDELFLARVDLLNAQNDAAASRLATVLDAAEAHDAVRRVELEMRLACEVPRDMLFRLTRMCEAIRLDKARESTRPATIGRHRAVMQAVSGVERIIGTSRAMETLRETVFQFAQLDVPVLITGETGTGKELVARAIHEEGPRRDEPFVVINCGTIPESLLESELFGHEKGAFSGATATHRGLFEEAENGTLLLDEIGDIPPRLQLALLRVLETGEIKPVGSSRSRTVRCRIIAATNADLEAKVREGRFRSDILFRLRRLEIRIPPLRERREDILPLAQFFLNADRPPGVRAVMSPALCDVLLRHTWPGNVRELRNVIERMRIMNSDKLHYDVPDVDLGILPDFAPSQHFRAIPAKGNNAAGLSTARRLDRLREMFRHHHVLTRAEVIEALGVSPNTATRDLQILCREGWIEKKQPTASPRSVYFVLCDRQPHQS
ncbi:MAG: sigma 54-interacting transcriptional regulator, partial [Kiritimatiellae bacterium]|nr:sigma 54-interacting transcriptional regulator [Kiritimatiellia bacterium]